MILEGPITVRVSFSMRMVDQVLRFVCLMHRSRVGVSCREDVQRLGFKPP